MFDETDKRFVQHVAPYLAEGARRSLLFGEATEPETPHAPGLLVLSNDWQIESSTPGVDRWLEDLLDGDLRAGRLPSEVLTVAGRHCDRPTALRQARSPWRGCSPGRAGGWFCTVQRCGQGLSFGWL